MLLSLLHGQNITNSGLNNIIKLPTTYIKRSVKKKVLTDQIESYKDTALNATPAAGGQDSYFLKGLESRHTSYYWGNIPITNTLKSCETHLDKLPTMVRRGTGLGGALIYNLPQERFQTTMGVSTNGGIEQKTSFHAEKNNRFLTGSFACENNGGWISTPSRYRQTGIKDRVSSIEGAFQAGHQDNDQKFTISSINQYTQNTYDDLYHAVPFSEQEYQRFFNLFGASYERQNWHAFAAFHSTKTLVSTYPSQQNISLTASVNKTETDYNFGCFTEQINNHKVYRYDIYGGRKIGFLYPSLRVIQTERQILCPLEITIDVAPPVKIICGNAYHLPDQVQRFDPQFGNFDLKPECNQHCHIVHSWGGSNWTVNQTLFINHIKDMISFSFEKMAYKNCGTLNSIDIDQSIGYEGFDRYKIGFAHTYCVLDGSEPILRRPSWKLLMWQRFHLSEDTFVDLKTHFKSSCLDGERIEFSKHVKMPGVFLLDLSTTHTLNKNWTVLCEVKNLTNQHYENPCGFLAKGIEAWVRLVYTV